MYPRFTILFATIAFAVTVTADSSSSYCCNVNIPTPNSNEGCYRANPGDYINIGWHFSPSDNCYSDIVTTWTNANFTWYYSCEENGRNINYFSVLLSEYDFTIPSGTNSGTWCPSNDENVSWQSNFYSALPALCGEGRPIYSTIEGGSFEASVTSSAAFNFQCQFHHRIPNAKEGSAGNKILCEYCSTPACESDTCGASWSETRVFSATSQCGSHTTTAAATTATSSRGYTTASYASATTARPTTEASSYATTATSATTTSAATTARPTTAASSYATTTTSAATSATAATTATTAATTATATAATTATTAATTAATTSATTSATATTTSTSTTSSLSGACTSTELPCLPTGQLPGIIQCCQPQFAQFCTNSTSAGIGVCCQMGEMACLLGGISSCCFSGCRVTGGCM